MEMVNSIRYYTNTHVNPLLTPSLETQSDFIPEAIPSFAAREIFENLRKNKEYKNYFYKDATLNPTNLRDKADQFETDIIEQFRTNPELKTISGFRSLLEDKLFYSARPFAISQQSCLRCHSSPEIAPKSHIETYGTENGFGWKLDEIIGSQIIYIPASQVFENARHTFSLVIVIFIAIFTAVILLINFLLKKNVIQPIKPMARLAQKLGNDTADADEDQEIELNKLTAIAKRSDELGQLGRVFQRMAHEVRDREQRLRQQVQALRIEIDQTKKIRQVNEIADNTYFRKLQQEAKDIRDKWKDANEKGE
jgi:methyl-accepting chemotaxis protein